ncbi:hypothetical protein BCR39DRAFT_458352, partial [Naematelia encephala]
RILRDIRKRKEAAQYELQRQAHLFVARNTSLPAAVRHKAQLSLNALNNGKGSATQIRNRCVETGRARGVFTKFGINRYRFRERASAGQLPGVHKASW